MAYTKTIWVNNSAPAISATNLNKIENQLESNTNDIDTNTTNISTNATNIENLQYEEITTTNATAFKYNDGRLITYGKKSASSVGSGSAFGSGLYRTNSIAFDDFPVSYISIPNVYYNIESCSSETNIVFCVGALPNRSSITNPGNVSLIKNTNTAFTGVVTYVAIGKWK